MAFEDQQKYEASEARYYSVFAVCSVSLGASFYIMYKIRKNPAETLNYRTYMWATAAANFFGGYQLYKAQAL